MFNNIVEPTNNIVWPFKFSSISPDVKGFILETQSLLILLVDFVFCDHLGKTLLFVCYFSFVKFAR